MTDIDANEFRADMNTFLRLVQKRKIASLPQMRCEIARVMPLYFEQSTAGQELERLRQSAFIGDVLSPIEVSWHAIIYDKEKKQ